MMTTILLRLVLAASGLAVVLLGVNVGLGGMLTLGWQGPTDFLTVSDPAAFAVQDNHVRFLGGYWLAAGAILLLGAVFFRTLNRVLIALLTMAVVGGLTRLSALDADLLLGADIAPSLFAELVLFPALAVWVYRAGQATAR